MTLYAFYEKAILPTETPGAIETGQENGATFTLSFGACSWMSSTRDIVFAPTLGSADSAFNCLAGPWPAEYVAFTLDGELPDSSNGGATSTWTNISAGPHSLDTSPRAPIQLHHDVTVDGDTELWATLYFTHMETRPDIPPTAAPTEAATETPAPPATGTIEAPVPSGGVQIYLLDCQVATGDASWIGQMYDGAPDFSGCYPANIDAREWGLRVDEARPDSFSGNTAVWTNLADGAHTATTGRGASLVFSVTNGSATLQAYYGPADGSVSVTELPNTGAGVGSEAGFGVALAALAMSTAAGTAGLALRRRR
ncbi:MAG: hypothetical protein QM589_01430 [Thermomicrobiales bacterium]